MKKVLFPIVVVILVVCLAPVMAAPVAADPGNLLDNPGAEDGDMTGWTASLGVAAVESLTESCGEVLPNSGSLFFTMGPNGAASPASMEQTIALTGLGGTPVSFEAGGWVQTEWYWEEPPGWPDPETAQGPYDRGALLVEFFDGEGESLGVLPLSPVEHPCCELCDVPHTYAEFSMSGAVPEGAATAVYKLEGYRMVHMYINVFYDDLYFSVDVAPPPPVGGTIIPTDKLGLIIPWIMASALIVVAGVSLALWNKRRGTEKASDR